MQTATCYPFIAVRFENLFKMPKEKKTLQLLFSFPTNNLEKTDPSEIERTYNISKQQTRFNESVRTNGK